MTNHTEILEKFLRFFSFIENDILGAQCVVKNKKSDESSENCSLFINNDKILEKSILEKSRTRKTDYKSSLNNNVNIKCRHHVKSTSYYSRSIF